MGQRFLLHFFWAISVLFVRQSSCTPQRHRALCYVNNTGGGLVGLFEEARECQRCYPGEDISIPLPDPKNSNGKADILFVNERPGRIGTGNSGFISFDNDDPSAEFFKECFSLISVDRRLVFITNACLCHPIFEGYRDTAPSVREMKNCHYWLSRQLEMTDPQLVVTIGAVAFQSVLRHFNLWATYKNQKFLSLVGSVIADSQPWLYPLSHTSRLGRVNRPAHLQKNDWRKIPEILEKKRDAT